MNENECCLICLDDSTSVNCILECCKKKVHSSCIKQWWNVKNMELNDAFCPHCRQRAKLKKIKLSLKNKILPINDEIPPINNNEIPPINNNEIPNINNNITNYSELPTTIFNLEEHTIRPNPLYDLTDDDIFEINSNRNNIIPIHNFHYDSDNSSGNTESIQNTKVLICKIVTCLLILLLIMIFILKSII